MKPVIATLMTTLVTLTGCLWLAGCGAWELPALKTPRICDKPEATITVEPDQLRLKVALREPSRDIDKVIWEFGDGTTQQATPQSSVIRSYTASNTYTIKATLTNLCGEQKVVSRQVQVTNVVKPSIVTLEDPEIQYTTARLRVQLVSAGNDAITRYGICWSATSVSPSIENGDSTTDATLPNPTVNTPVNVFIPRLQANTPYWFRAFAINTGGIGYGLTLDPPRRTNRYPDFAITEVTCGADCFTTARVNWRVADPGQPQLTQYGVAYSITNALPEITNSPFVEATGQGVPIALTGLLPGRDYILRLYVRTATGVYYAPGPPATYRTQSSLNRELVLDLPFFEPQFNASSLNDLSGSGNNATQKNSVPVYTDDRTGAAGRALQLQGRANDYCYVADSPLLHPDASLTVSMWFQVGAQADTMALWSKARFADGAGDQYNCFLLKPGSASERAISVFVKPGTNCPKGDLSQSISAVFNLGADALRRWNHLAVIYRPNGVAVYLNGDELRNLRSYRTTDRLPTDCLFGELKFGSHTSRTPYYFNGGIDDIRLYRRELTAGEIQELTNR